MYRRSEKWKVRSLHTAGSLRTVAREIAKYKLYFVKVHGTREAVNLQVLTFSSELFNFLPVISTV
jgi:hypothetical protein